MRASALLLGGGALLVLAGVALWQTPTADLALHRGLRLDDAPAWSARTAALSTLGGAAGMVPVALAGAALLLARRRRDEALWLAATIASGRALVEGVKLVVERPRPPVADRLELVTSWSFPSSHSAGTMMTCLALALLARRRGAWPVAVAAAATIGWTRVALAVHWPSDVLAGWGIGMAWIGAAMRWLPTVPDPVAAREERAPDPSIR